MRFTGGEPLVRRGLVDIVRRTSALGVETSLTTNALGLARTAHALAEAGLDRVNVSLDSIRRETFHEITRRDRLADVLAGLAAAQEAGLGPVKVNAVLMRGRQRRPGARAAALGDRRGLRAALHRADAAGRPARLEPRGHGHRGRDLRPARAGVRRSRRPPSRGGAPRRSSSSSTAGPATVGVIASVTRPFCGDCDRVRLTADGQVRNCLFAREESDLRAALRGGATDEEIADRWVVAMRGKRAGHGIDDPTFLQPDRPMSAIGG